MTVVSLGTSHADISSTPCAENPVRHMFHVPGFDVVNYLVI